MYPYISHREHLFKLVTNHQLYLWKLRTLSSFAGELCICSRGMFEMRLLVTAY